MSKSISRPSSDPAEPPSPDAESSSELTEEEVFDVLSHRRRRFALHYLVQKGETELGDLAEYVAAWENEKDVQEITASERKHAYSALQQSHLPRMDEAGVVEFDKNRGTIEPSESLAELDIYMDVVRGGEIPWSEYYIGLSAVGAALVAALWMGAYPLTLLSETAWAAFLTTTFGVSALVHHYYARQTRLGVGERPPETDGR